MDNVRLFMIDDHKRLNKLLSNLRKDPSKKNIEKFKINTEKHQLLEEEYIFKAFITANEMYDIKKLMKEHEVMNELVDKMFLVKKKDRREMVKKLTLILAGHMKYEDNFLYPKLENLLDSKHKENLFKKIKNV